VIEQGTEDEGLGGRGAASWLAGKLSFFFLMIAVSGEGLITVFVLFFWF
jgi:hypothetical protein